MAATPLTAGEAAARLRGIALVCAAVLLFTVIDASAKYASRFVPTLEVVWARYTLGLLFSVIVLRPWKHATDYLTRRPVVQTVRSLFLFLSTVLNFFAIRHLPLDQTVSIAFVTPLLVTALAGPILGEWAGPRRWVAIAAGFVGVLIIVQPHPSAFQPAALFAIGAAFSYAGYALTTRALSATDSASGMLVYGTLLGTILMTPVLPVVAEAPPTWLVAGALAMTGIAGGLGHWLFIRASRYAPITVLAPFSYTQIVWMVAAGYLFFGDVPNTATLFGAAVVIASGLYVLYRERVHRDR